MSEDAVAILITLFMAMIAYIVYMRLVVVRRLNKKIDRFVDAALERQVVPLARAEDSGEVRALKQRLQVLERIAVEKEDSLSRQIDGLRAPDR